MGVRALVLGACLLASIPTQAAVCALIGDSIGAGSGLPNSQSRFVHLLQVERQLEIRDMSSPGAALGATGPSGFNNETTINQLSALAGLFSYLNCIIVQAGTNDYSRNIPWTDTVSGLSKILKWARDNGKKVMLLDPIWRAGEDVQNANGHTLNLYRYMNFLTCTQNYSDVCVMVYRSETIMGSASGAAYYLQAEVSSGKQLHPSAAGHRLLADWIKAAAARAGLF
jgi:lysophospholipase L1-like esterase